MPDPAAELKKLYDQVPASCCAASGECCVLSEEEFGQGYATMFPLYRAEYAHIATYLEERFGAARRRALFAFTEERPRRCPFLGADRGCTIYPVRPLICRTYGLMNPRTIAATLERYRGREPREWVEGFARREGSMLCPRVQVMEPEKLERHIHNLINFAYERALLELSRRVELVAGERRQLFHGAGAKRSLPLSWTWGGFNSIAAAPLEWVRRRFKAYWKKAELADLG